LMPQWIRHVVTPLTPAYAYNNYRTLHAAVYLNRGVRTFAPQTSAPPDKRPPPGYLPPVF